MKARSGRWRPRRFLLGFVVAQFPLWILPNTASYWVMRGRINGPETAESLQVVPEVRVVDAPPLADHHVGYSLGYATFRAPRGAYELGP